MNILLSGSSGFLGSNILKKIDKKEHKIRCIIRPQTTKKATIKEKIEIVEGDITKPETLSGKLDNCDAVIHLVGIIREFPTRGITFEKIHFEGSRNIIDEAKKSGTKHFLLMSALGTNAKASSRYHQTKFKAEQYLKQSGLTYTIFRPSIIFGERDNFINMLAGMIRLSPIIPVIGDGHYKLQPVYVDDLAQGVINAINNPIAYNKTYEVGGPDQLEYNQLLDIIGKQLRSTFIKIHQPVFLLKPLINLLEGFSFFPITKDQLSMLLSNNTCDPQLFCNELNIKLTPFAEGIKKWL